MGQRMTGIEQLQNIFDSNKGLDGTLVISKGLAQILLIEHSQEDANMRRRRNERGGVIAGACAKIRGQLLDIDGLLKRDSDIITEALVKIEALAFAGGVPPGINVIDDAPAPHDNLELLCRRVRDLELVLACSDLKMVDKRLDRLEKKAGCNYPLQSDSL